MADKVQLNLTTIGAWENKEVITKFSTSVGGLPKVDCYQIGEGDLVALYSLPSQRTVERNLVMSIFNGFDGKDLKIKGNLLTANKELVSKYFGICVTPSSSRSIDTHPRKRDLAIAIAGMYTVTNYCQSPMIKAGEPLVVELKSVKVKSEEARLVFVPYSKADTEITAYPTVRARALCDSSFLQNLQVLLIP